MTRIPGTMRAAYIESLGGPEKIRVGELPVPTPGPTQVLVRVRACSVNLVDTIVRRGAYRTPTPFPFVIGRDLVGEVAQVGAGVDGFEIGERVWCNSLGHGGRQGAAAEYAVVDVDRAYPLPADVDPLQAVATFHPVATAHLALHVHGRLRPGETAVVVGGAGQVGRAAVRLAARAGARVVTTVGAADIALAQRLGAEVALDYHADDLPDHLREAVGDGVDVWLDTSGHNDLETAVDLLAHRGRIVLMAGVSSSATLPAGKLYTRDGSVHGFAISNARTSELADAARHIGAMLTAGALEPWTLRVLPLDAMAEAHEALESGSARGERIVVDLTR